MGGYEQILIRLENIAGKELKKKSRSNNKSVRGQEKIEEGT